MSKELNQAEAIFDLAGAVQRLGLADAGTPMGAIEVLAMEVKEGCAEIASALHAVAEAIRDHEVAIVD